MEFKYFNKLSRFPLGIIIEKCMDLLNDTKTYKPCKDTTKKLHRDIQESLRRLNREHGSSRLHDWSKLHYNRLLPTGNSSPAPRVLWSTQDTQD